MTSRTPPLLEPHLTPIPAESSLAVLTSVLGASTNWLVLRYLHALLRPNSLPSSSAVTTEPGTETQEVSVLLVSFLRDWTFWREGLARLGVDLEGATAARKGRFGFVDGLGVFSGGDGSGYDASVNTPQQQQQQGRPLSGAGATASRGAWRRALTSAAPEEMARVILKGVEALKRGSQNGTAEDTERKVVLVVDGLDFVLAASDADSQTGSVSGTAMVLRELLMDLREQTHAAIITLAADDPLIKEQETPLEKQHAWFALSLVHEADTVLSLRLLDTGAAKDVSGVIRITHGGAQVRSDDREYLYHVGGDGGVRVFERGQ